MAFALVMADKQWGGKGSLDKNYLDYAKGQITNVWNNEICDSKVLRAGDSWGTGDSLNISYFAPYYYRVFKTIDGDPRLGRRPHRPSTTRSTRRSRTPTAKPTTGSSPPGAPATGNVG